MVRRLFLSLCVYVLRPERTVQFVKKESKAGTDNNNKKWVERQGETRWRER